MEADVAVASLSPCLPSPLPTTSSPGSGPASPPSKWPPARPKAATSLANLALDNGRNKKIIIEEGGVPPLLALHDSTASLDAQIAATTALTNLFADCELISLIVPIVAHVSPMHPQARLAALIARIAAHDPVAQEFSHKNTIRPLVSLLSFELPHDGVSVTPCIAGLPRLLVPLRLRASCLCRLTSTPPRTSAPPPRASATTREVVGDQIGPYPLPFFPSPDQPSLLALS